MGGGSGLTLAAPFPDDPVDPVDPDMNSKNAVFIVRVVNLGQNAALALCLFDFFKDALHETLTFGTKIRKSSRTKSKKFARFRAGDGSAQNFAVDLMGLVKSFVEELASKTHILKTSEHFRNFRGRGTILILPELLGLRNKKRRHVFLVT